MTAHEYDPERALWVPGRRRFLFLLGAAVVAPALPAPPAPRLAGMWGYMIGPPTTAPDLIADYWVLRMAHVEPALIRSRMWAAYPVQAAQAFSLLPPER